MIYQNKYFSVPVGVFFWFIMLLIFGIFIAFPFSCFIQRGSTQNLIDNQKKTMIEDYTNSQLSYNEKTLNIFNDKIDNISTEIDSLNASKYLLKDSLESKKGNMFDIALSIRILEVDIKKSETKIKNLVEKRDDLKSV